MKFHRRIIYPLLLAFALLFAQMGGLAHGISHIIAGQSRGSEQSLPHDKYCDQCAAYGQIGSAVNSSPISFFASKNYATPHFAKHGSFISTTFVVFAARAPPYSA